MLVRATYPFFVERGGRIYEVGETYDATQAVADRLVGMGVAEPVEQGQAKPAPRKPKAKPKAEAEVEG